MSRSTVVRLSIFLATVAAAWAVLSIGTAAEPPTLTVGQLADQDYSAGRDAPVVDAVATEAQREAARNAVPEPQERNAEVQAAATASVEGLFDDLQRMVIGEDPRDQVAPVPELPEDTTTSTSPDASTTTTGAPPLAVLAGTLYIDTDGDAAFNPESGIPRPDTPLARVTVRVITSEGTESVVTDDSGSWSYEYPGGPAVVVVDTSDADIPDGYYQISDGPGTLVECSSGEQCEVSEEGFRVSIRPIDEVVNGLEYDLPPETLTFLAGVAADDVIREALGEPLHLPKIEETAIDQLFIQFAGEIEPTELQAARFDVRSNPRGVVHEDTGSDPEGALAAAEVAAANLAPNYLVNEELFEELKAAAADAVPDQIVNLTTNQLIVERGVPLTQFHVDAIAETAVPTIDEQPSVGLAAVVALLVGLLGLYLANFRPEFWARPRMVSLLGIVIVLAAASVRGTLAFHDRLSWYILPAVAFGFVTAVLFDQRIAVLIALAVGVLTALGTLDPGITVYAVLAALVPIPFVSSVSTRGSFRNAVVLSAVVGAVAAGATAWFFHVGELSVGEVVPEAMAYGFGVSVVASLIGLAALQFFESAFDITTTLGLLDLTDRNHKALQMLQEEAFGTFNHSLMVGTLADAAARSIGVNALLARAMAYYHDLGKTQNPTFFIENQFGASNPHDELDPVESAEIIRSHVTAGVELAREYKIPTEVAEGIVSHHGDGVMRFFYEKAREGNGEVDIDLFRHVGHKPRTAETAILMLSDALEAACRAVFQAEEPTPEAIEKVVDRVVNEKMDDGQLSESPLTLGQLSTIRRAFLDSLVGHYHQRIAYPNFPGS